MLQPGQSSRAERVATMKTALVSDRCGRRAWRQMSRDQSEKDCVGPGKDTGFDTACRRKVLMHFKKKYDGVWFVCIHCSGRSRS